MPQADAAFREALDIIKKSGTSVGGDDILTLYNEYAWFLATCSDASLRRPDLAVELARKGVKSSPPRNGTIQNTLGVAYYRAGDWKASVEALSQSMKWRAGGDANDWIFLAMSHWRMGEEDQARTWYDKAVAGIKAAPSTNEELQRFWAEAAALLGVPGPVAPSKPGSLQ